MLTFRDSFLYVLYETSPSWIFFPSILLQININLHVDYSIFF
jgi:hypothetical protein